MRENLATIFFILILLFGGFAMYYYYKNSPVSIANEFIGLNSGVGYQVLGSSDGKMFLAAQVGQMYKKVNVSVFITLDYDGPEPFEVNIVNYGSLEGIWEYTTTDVAPDPNYNFSYYYPSKSYSSAYSSDKLVLMSFQLNASYVISSLYQNGTVFKWVIKVLWPPKILIRISDAAGNPISLTNFMDCQNPLEITLTLQVLRIYNPNNLPRFEYFLKVLSIDSQGPGWCSV